MGVTLRQRKYKSGTISFYLDIYENRERKFEFLKIKIKESDPRELKKEKKELAENIRSKRSLEIQSGEHGFIPSHKKKIIFNDYYLNFLNNYEKNDIRMFNHAYEKFGEFTNFQKIKASQITFNLIDGFREYLQSGAARLSGETPQNYFVRFKRVIKKAYQDGLITPTEYDKIRGLSIKKKANRALRKEILNIEELKLLKETECSNPEVKKAFLFACFTGLGEAEIRSLTWNRIQDQKLRIFREKTGEPVFNKLPTFIMEMLEEIGKPHEFVFSLPSDVSVGKSLKKWVANAGINKNISFYCGRHSFAVMLLKNGTNLKTVADLMGHVDTTHTVKYLHYVDDLKDEAIDNLPEI